MKLKKLFAIEVGSVAIVIIAIMFFVEVTPYLASSKPNSQIGVFNQKVYAQETVTLKQGERTQSRFNYTTYDPAILVVDLKFQSWDRPGYLSLYCNGILIVTIDATPKNPDVQLTTITVSGYDLVKPPAGYSYSYTYGNEIALLSDPSNGFEGTFNYQISIRGSR